MAKSLARSNIVMLAPFIQPRPRRHRVIDLSSRFPSAQWHPHHDNTTLSYHIRSVQPAHEQYKDAPPVECHATDARPQPTVRRAARIALRDNISYRGLSPRPDIAIQPPRSHFYNPRFMAKLRLVSNEAAMALRSLRSVWPQQEVYDAWKTRLILRE